MQSGTRVYRKGELNFGTVKALIFFLTLHISAVCVAAAPVFASKIHQSVIADPQFNKTYIESGCFVRAHWIADLIRKSGHEPIKVFISTAAPEEKMHLNLSSGKTASWIFHVTAGLKDHSGETWVLDPTLSTDVITLRQWNELIEKQNPGLKLNAVVTDSSVYHVDPSENAEFSRLGGPFSEAAMDFVKYSMENLFIWESAK